MAFSPTHGRLDIAYVQSPVLGHGLEREKVGICYKRDLVSASKRFSKYWETNVSSWHNTVHQL